MSDMDPEAEKEQPPPPPPLLIDESVIGYICRCELPRDSGITLPPPDLDLDDSIVITPVDRLELRPPDTLLTPGGWAQPEASERRDPPKADDTEGTDRGAR